MYNLLIALGAGIVTFAGTFLAFSSVVAGIVPAIFVFGLAMFLLARRTASQVQEALAPLQGLAEKRQLVEMRRLIEDTRDTYGNWQLFLGRQMDGQLGMLAYAQMNFDEALPLLEASFRDWSAAVAAACVHYRRGRFDEAWEWFDKAHGYAPKEASVYQMWATLRARHGDRSEALEALALGLEAIPGNEPLRAMKKRIANKQKVDVTTFQMVWFQFFPEEAMKRMAMRGTRGNPMAGMPGRVVQQMGPPGPKQRGKLARRR